MPLRLLSLLDDAQRSTSVPRSHDKSCCNSLTIPLIICVACVYVGIGSSHHVSLPETVLCTAISIKARNICFLPLSVVVVMWVMDFVESISRWTVSHCALWTFSKVLHPNALMIPLCLSRNRSHLCAFATRPRTTAVNSTNRSVTYKPECDLGSELNHARDRGRGCDGLCTGAAPLRTGPGFPPASLA